MPSSFARSSVMRTTAAAASLMPQALPAVTVPPFLKAGGRAASFSIVISGLGYSSVSYSFGSPFRCGRGTGEISSLKRPSLIARPAFCWLRRAKASCSSLGIEYCSASLSAVSPIPPPIGCSCIDFQIMSTA